MAAIVVLSVALTVLAVGVVVVAALQVLRGARRLKTAVEGAAARLSTAAEDLRAELAITEAEVASLSQPPSGRQGRRGTSPPG